MYLEKIPDEKIKELSYNAEIGYDVPQELNQLLEDIVSVRKYYQEIMENNKICSRGYLYYKVSNIIKGIVLKRV